MRLALALLVLACVFAWGGAFLWSGEASGVVAAKRARPAIAAAGANAVQADAPDLMGAPSLFRALVPPYAGPRAGESFALVGLVARDAQRIALLRDEADQRAWSARVGDHVGAWTIERIGARCVTLRRGGGRRQERCL